MSRQTLELRKEKNAGRQEEGERGREHREAGRGKGEQRAVEGGTERQRVLGETAREPLHEKAERSSKKALRAGVLSSTLSSAAVRVGRRPDGRRGRGPPLPRSPRGARRNPRRKRRGRPRARAAVWAAGPGGEAAARSVRLTHSRPARSGWACARRPAARRRMPRGQRPRAARTDLPPMPRRRGHEQRADSDASSASPCDNSSFRQLPGAVVVRQQATAAVGCEHSRSSAQLRSAGGARAEQRGQLLSRRRSRSKRAVAATLAGSCPALRTGRACAGPR